jgi:type III secretion protein X
MAEMRIGSRLFFDRGIDRVVDAPDAAQASLPEGDALVPAALARWAALEELLHAENLESLLDAWVRPELAERELLAPRAFRAAMEAVLARFRGTAQARRQANPRLGRLLDEAARVLGEDIELRDLLQMYRGALLQG